MQTIQTNKNRLPSQAGGFLWKCTSKAKICAYYPILRKKVQGQTLLRLMSCIQPLVFADKRNNLLKCQT